MIVEKLIAATGDLGSFTPATTLLDPAKDFGSGLAASNKAEVLVSLVLGLVTILGGLSLIFYFVLGALNWITAAGDTGKIQKARDQMVQAVVGMIVVVIAYSVIGVIGNFLGLNLLSPGTGFYNIVTGHQ